MLQVSTSVHARPPTRPRASSTRTDNPAAVSSRAAVSPAAPAPTTQTSRPSVARANDEPQDRLRLALVVREGLGGVLERIRRGHESLHVDGAGGDQTDRGLEVRRRERARAVERELLEVERKEREVGHRAMADPVDEQ